MAIPGSAHLPPSGRPHNSRAGDAVPYVAGRTNVTLALTIAFTLPIRFPVTGWLTIGTFLAVLLFPIVGEGYRTQTQRVLTLLSAVAVPAAAFLAMQSIDDDAGRSIQRSLAVYQIGVLLAICAGVGATVWCIGRLGVPRFITVWASGLTFQHIVFNNILASGNPWKFGLALPITLIVLTYLARRGPLPVAAGFVAVCTISASEVYRSWLALVALAFGFALLTSTSDNRWKSVRRSIPNVLAAMGGLLFASYIGTSLFTRIALTGGFGEYIRERTDRQVTAAGSLILGGRPEWASGISLMTERPWGFGLGVTPSSSDTKVAVRALPIGNHAFQDISDLANNFQKGSYALHSTLWIFWAQYGLVGVGLVILMMATLVSALVKIYRSRTAFALGIPISILILGSLWDLFYSPPFATIMMVSIGVATSVNQGAATGIPARKPYTGTRSERISTAI